MPFPNFHAARVVDPDKFEKDSFRTINIGDKKSGISAIVGRLKGEKSSKVQTYRFDKDKFTPAKAKKWLKDHDVKFTSFEEATGKNDDESDREYKDYLFELLEIKKATNDDGEELGVFSGAFATQDKDRGGDIIASNAFVSTIKRYKDDNRNIKLYYNHNTFDLPIGIVQAKSIKKEDGKWLFKGELNLNTQLGQDVYALMKQGALTDMSFNYSIKDFELRKDGTRFIKELELWEISVVGEPMNTKAKITEVKADELGEPSTDIEINNDKISDEEIKPLLHFDLNDVKELTTREDFNKILSKSGAFSNEAAEYLASLLAATQRKSGVNYELILQKLNQLIKQTKTKGKKNA